MNLAFWNKASKDKKPAEVLLLTNDFIIQACLEEKARINELDNAREKWLSDCKIYGKMWLDFIQLELDFHNIPKENIASLEYDEGAFNSSFNYIDSSPTLYIDLKLNDPNAKNRVYTYRVYKWQNEDSKEQVQKNNAEYSTYKDYTFRN